MKTGKKVEAMTLPEVLVMILIMGIIFIAVLEGYSTVNRFSMKTVDRILDRNENYYGYHRFVDLIGNIKSVEEVDADTYLLVMNEGNSRKLGIEDSRLILTSQLSKDTLFENVSALNIIQNHIGPDSIQISLTSKDDHHILSFPLPQSADEDYEALFMDMEKSYH